MQQEDLPFADDEVGPALHFDRFKALALEHFGGSADTHDVAPFNRLTGATMATHLTFVKPGDVVIGVSASHSHPSVVRAANHVGSRFTDTAGLAAFKEALTREPKVTLVVLTRLAVTYELLPIDAIDTIVRLSHDKGALVYVDDWGGALLGPAARFRSAAHARAWESMWVPPASINTAPLDRALACLPGARTWSNASAQKGSNLAWNAGRCSTPPWCARWRNYSPQRVRDLIAATKEVGAELRC